MLFEQEAPFQQSKDFNRTKLKHILKSCARLSPSYLIILIPSQVSIVILQQIKK